jgi:2-alkyl-3-oxoalkanoate reductase
MRALVTGGGGFLGLAVVRRLRERGDEVRSFSRSRYPVLEALGVEQFQGDLADAEAVERAAAGCDVVLHVAAKAGVWGPYQEFFRANVEGTRNVLAACRRQGVRRLVHTSTPSVVFAGRDLEGVDESVPYADHFHAAYPETKRIAEEEVLKQNGESLATVALRPHLIWGPGDPHLVPRLLARARAGRLRVVGPGTNRVDSVFVENAADAHVLAADRLAPGSPLAGRAYFVSNGEPMVLWDFINSILATAGLPPVKKRVPAGLAYAAGWLFETLHRALRLSGEPRMTRFVARELATAHWFDLTAARRDLGYQPRVSTEEGLKRLADWFRETGTAGAAK